MCIREGDVTDLDILVAPLVEQLDAANLLGNILGKDGVARGALDLNFAVRHDCGVLEGDWDGGMGVVSELVVVGSCKKVAFVCDQNGCSLAGLAHLASARAMLAARDESRARVGAWTIGSGTLTILCVDLDHRTPFCPLDGGYMYSFGPCSWRSVMNMLQ